MSDIFINISRIKHWNRNPKWLDLPTISAGDNRMVGLYAVYSHLVNELTVYFATTGNVTVDWGDGTSSSVPTTTDTTHTYTYASLPGPILQDVGGYSYKMVIVDISFATTSTVIVTRPSTTETSAPSKWLDIAIDNANMTNFSPSETRKAMYLERLLIYDNALAVNMGSGWNYMTALKITNIDFSVATSNNSGLQSLGDIRQPDESPVNFIMNGATTTAQAAQYSSLSEVGDISVTGSSSAYRMFINNINLEKVGDINVSGVSTIAGMFQECRSLRKIGTITSTSALTTINSTFRLCNKLEDVNITDCSGVTDAGSAFIFTPGIKNVTLTGLTRAIDLSGNDMDATAIDALFTSLGTASGAQTVTVTNNPGASTCTTSIATSKGWTVAT